MNVKTQQQSIRYERVVFPKNADEFLHHMDVPNDSFFKAYSDGTYLYEIDGIYSIIIEGFGDVLKGLGADECAVITVSNYRYAVKGILHDIVKIDGKYYEKIQKGDL